MKGLIYKNKTIRCKVCGAHLELQGIGAVGKMMFHFDPKTKEVYLRDNIDWSMTFTRIELTCTGQVGYNPKCKPHLTGWRFEPTFFAPGLSYMLTPHGCIVEDKEFIKKLKKKGKK